MTSRGSRDWKGSGLEDVYTAGPSAGCHIHIYIYICICICVSIVFVFVFTAGPSASPHCHCHCHQHYHHCQIAIDAIISMKMVRYTDGSVAQGWVKEGAWHGVYRSRSWWWWCSSSSSSLKWSPLSSSWSVCNKKIRPFRGCQDPYIFVKHQPPGN